MAPSCVFGSVGWLGWGWVAAVESVSPKPVITHKRCKTHHRLLRLLRRQPALVVRAPVVVPIRAVERPAAEPLEAWGRRPIYVGVVV